MSAKHGKSVAVVVDDEVFVRMEMADALSLSGCEVVEFASGEAALAYLQRGKRVDVLVTDIRLSGSLSGWDLARDYREKNERVGVIYCSANPQVSERQVPQSIFIEKPCKSSRLLAAARAVLGQRA